jgi:hypothetical protein
MLEPLEIHTCGEEEFYLHVMTDTHGMADPPKLGSFALRGLY